MKTKLPCLLCHCRTLVNAPLFTEKLSQCVAITTTQKYVKYWAKMERGKY
ncbi:hypothetical protein VEx25_0315 [Vibrio antiquarius]|uniref:Uncharacterized protein n=1 Tax=Vibrio antiquarius (strain Ex25) TaxID=150340 RepID=A0ABM9WTG7_VIBAE|nr:hypothetical protein VEx25_0315 [Vibrio antiquarius]